MNTDARRKASAAYHAKRTEAGLRKVTLWLPDATREELARLGKVYGSKDRAAAICIDHAAHRQADKTKIIIEPKRAAPLSAEQDARRDAEWALTRKAIESAPPVDYGKVFRPHPKPGKAK